MKTKIIGTRIDDNLYNLFIAYAQERCWSNSFTLAKILEYFFSKENRVS